MIKIVAWITEWEQSVDTNPILFCKFLDEMVEGYDLFKEDFVVIIQSPFQRHMRLWVEMPGVLRLCSSLCLQLPRQLDYKHYLQTHTSREQIFEW